MKEEEIMQIIQKRINLNPLDKLDDKKYSGFDMSGYNNLS